MSGIYGKSTFLSQLWCVTFWCTVYKCMFRVAVCHYALSWDISFVE